MPDETTLDPNTPDSNPSEALETPTIAPESPRSEVDMSPNKDSADAEALADKHYE